MDPPVWRGWSQEITVRVYLLFYESKKIQAQNKNIDPFYVKGAEATLRLPWIMGAVLVPDYGGDTIPANKYVFSRAFGAKKNNGRLYLIGAKCTTFGVLQR